MMILLVGGSGPASEDEGPGEICIANIGPRERRKRLLGGVAAFVGGLIVLAALMVLGWERWWRLALLMPFWGAASGFFQWREKT